MRDNEDLLARLDSRRYGVMPERQEALDCVLK